MPNSTPTLKKQSAKANSNIKSTDPKTSSVETSHSGSFSHVRVRPKTVTVEVTKGTAGIYHRAGPLGANLRSNHVREKTS